MEIRFLKEGAPDCPILQIYGDKAVEYDLLINEIGQLVSGEKDKLNVTNLENFISHSNIKVVFTVSETDIGVVTNDEMDFNCYLSKNTWSGVIRKLTVLKPPSHGYGWLDETADISLLISKGLSW
jgi:hypothetical protein